MVIWSLGAGLDTQRDNTFRITAAFALLIPIAVKASPLLLTTSNAGSGGGGGKSKAIGRYLYISNGGTVQGRMVWIFA